MTGCGAGQTMGHGEIAICGEVYYTEVWMCGACARKRLREVIAERDRYKAIADAFAHRLYEAGLITDAAPQQQGDIVVVKIGP